jgi:hypothetical protein
MKAMEEEPQSPDSEAENEEEPPPFEPDPELVTYPERGRKSEAPARFRRALDELPKNESR